MTIITEGHHPWDILSQLPVEHRYWCVRCSVGFGIKDNDTGKIICNKCGYVKTEGKWIDRWENPVDQEDTTGLCTVRQLVEDMIKMKSDQMEMYFAGKDGKQVSVEIRITAIQD